MKKPTRKDYDVKTKSGDTRSVTKHRAPPLMAANSGVWLKANKREGQKREHGIYLSPSGKDCHIIRIDEQYRTRNDDGMREVSTGQMELNP